LSFLSLIENHFSVLLILTGTQHPDVTP